MEGRLNSRRHDVKQRRKTLRQSVLEERRQTGLMSNESTPDENPGRSLRTRAANTKTEASRQLKERKARQAITAKEVKKVRPPFNNYIRVKHTGLSPFRSYQDASKRSRVAPWRAPPPPPKAQELPAAVPKSKAPGQQKKAETAGTVRQHPPSVKVQVPGNRIAAGVMQFGMKSHGSSKTAFKPPAKIQPIPFAAQSTRTRAPRVETEKEKLRIVPKNAAAKKTSPKARIVKKPVPRAPPKKLLPPISEPPLQLSNTTQIAPIKPRGMKKHITGIVQNMENKQLPKRASRLNVEPSSRVLRSSQASLTDCKENMQPQVAIRVSKRATKKAASPRDTQVSGAPPSSSPTEDRIKGLEERSAQLTKETDRLRGLAEEWASLKATLPLPASVADEIDSVTGQTILLTTKKFIQYKGLIEGAHTNPRTTLEDLDGFWEMVYIQVRQLDDKYKALNAMKEKNWNTGSPKLFRNVQIREKKRSKPAKKPTIGQSNFQKFFAEKLKKEAACSEGTPSNPSTIDSIENKFNRVTESPLLSMSVDEEFVTPTRVFSNTQSASTPRVTPRMIENALRASRSRRYSDTMMRLSSIFQDVSTS